MWRRLLVLLLGVSLLAAACGGGGGTAAAQGVIETVSPADAAALIESAPAGLVILDVRTPGEFADIHLVGAVNLDYRAPDFAGRLAALNREVPYVLYCRTGNRSADAREMMRDLGFREVHEIRGGIEAWDWSGLPTVQP